MITLLPGGFLKAVDEDTSFTAGSILFRGASVISQDNSNLFWDNTNKRLGIQTATPAESLHVVAASGGARMLVEATNGESAVIKMKNTDEDTEYALFADGGGFAFWRYSNSTNIFDFNGPNLRWTIKGAFDLPDLPTEDPSRAGALWSDGGTVKLSAG